ncbi:MAG: isoprenylcysteine carboxylmethyltransferase family protein [Sphingomicrobium sp.]
MNRVIDLGEKLLIIMLAAPFLIAFAHVLPRHPNFLLLLASESLTVLLVLTRRAGSVSLSPYVLLIAFLGTAGPLAARPVGVALLPPLITSVAMFCGLLLSVGAKLALNRSFGLVAANRGVKRRGPYRFVRHPMYLGYIITQLGFLLGSFSARNLLIYSLSWLMNWLRIREEERYLMLDSDYRAFASEVTNRLLPRWPRIGSTGASAGE